MADEARTRVDSIQALRILAATMVVFGHTQGFVARLQGRYGIDEAWLNLVVPVGTGACGVDIFFVISGFVMALVTNDMHKRKRAVTDFIQKRLIRILPCYWIWTGVFVFLLFFFPQFFTTHIFSVKETIMSFLLIPYAPTGNNESPVLAVGWTLSYEIYFYTLVCIGILFSRKTFIVGLGIFFFITTVIFPQRHGPISNLTANPLLWEFYGGVLIFEFYKTKKRLPVMFSLSLSILAIVAFWCFAEQSNTHLRFVFWGIPAFALVLSCVCLEKELGRRVPKIVVFGGDSSYTLYLSHCVTVPGMGKAFAMAGLHKILPPDVQIVFYTAASVVLGAALYAGMEKPLLNRLRAISLGEKTVTGRYDHF
jgi:peptidoglycan/LPS O-acetylase OafA/YrhL